MKKLLFFLAVFYTLQTYAQPYSISFAGAGLSTVKVQNLTTGVITDVPAGDVLLLSTTTGIPEINNMKSSGMKVYPNPMADKSTLQILHPVAGDAIISICDISGKVLTQFKGYVENASQEFSITGLKNGLYVINIQGNGYQFSEKLLSNGKSPGAASIVKISNNIHVFTDKKSGMVSKGVQGYVNMTYAAGERLKYTAVSGNSKTIMTDIPAADKTVTFTFTECKDVENNFYPIVQINDQLWMAENLKTTMYRNGVPIGTTSPYNKDISGESTPKYQWAYDGNEINVATYGRLYTWYAVTDSRNVCPTGWHVPTDAERTTLESYMIANGYNYDGTTIGNKIAKALASTTLWTSDVGNGTVGNSDYPTKRNATGYTALPGGYRDYGGAFSLLGNLGGWWSSTEDSTADAWCLGMNFGNSDAFRGTVIKQGGFSIRCLRD
jgi:uncharacterized protein (TIGR02145 family)